MSGLLLKNKVLAITRNENEAKEFSQLVSEQGGKAIALPTIEIVPAGPSTVQDFIDRLQIKKHHYCAFMSSQAVNVLFDIADKQKMVSALNSTTVIAVGPKTKQSLEKNGIHVNLTPEKFSSLGLIEMMAKQQNSHGKSIIIPRSSASNEFVGEALMSLGMEVDEIFLYSVRTCKPTPVWSDFSTLLKQKKIDAIIFTSASATESFFELMDNVISTGTGSSKIYDHYYDQLDNLTKVISIGPFTSKMLEKRHIRYFESEEHTVKGTFDLAMSIIL